MSKLEDVIKGPANRLPDRVTTFLTSHFCNILPGDASLIPPLLVDIQRHYQSTSKNGSGSRMSLHALIYGTANILFHIVIIRTYLGRLPMDDMTIYRLMSSKLPGVPIIRLPCDVEQALAACDGAEDTRKAHHTDTAVLYTSILQASAIEPVWDGLIACIHTATEHTFQWPSSEA